MAASGLDFMSGTHDNMIQGNVFTDLGGTGITLGKFAQDTLTEIHIPYNPVDKNEISTRDTVKNNLVTKVTTEIQGAIGIAAGYPRYLVIEHNEVSYTNYSGISVGFGWTKSSNAMTNNKINWNNIHHVSQLLADAGSIYTLSNQGSGSEIQYNYMHDIHGSQWADYWINGIYLDEGSSGFDVSHNVFVKAPSGIACNSCGSYTKSDNSGTLASTINNAGLEPDFKDIKNKLTTIIPDFQSTLFVPQGPYQGTAAQIPGKIEAENYDVGGPGISYTDNDPVNQGGVYRTDGVDVVENASNGYDVGYTITDEWLEYTVHVDKASTYQWSAKVASALDGAAFQMLLDSTIDLTGGTVDVPNDGAWDSYKVLTGVTPALTAGDHVLKLMIKGSYFNIDWIEFSDASTRLNPETHLKTQQDWKGAKVYDLSGHLIGVLKHQSDEKSLRSHIAQMTQRSGVYIVTTPQGAIAYRVNFTK